MKVNEVVDILKTDGVYLIENYIQDYVPLKDELTHWYNKIPDYREAGMNHGSLELQGEYTAGKNFKISNNSYSLFPELCKVFVHNQFISSVVDNFFGIPNNKGLQTFSTWEYKKVETEEEYGRAQFLHFDPYHALKFFVYLDDVDQENATTFYIPKTNKIGKYLRENRMMDAGEGYQGGLPHRIVDYPDIKVIEDDVVHVKAKAGSMLIFDTDTLHGGGILKSGERMVVVYHNRKN
tara:strand:+ start:757 stop:1464 length:708 start_codon:yes stop_codon:yes gene_type:complete